MDKPHKKLIAWKLGMEIASRIYRLTRHFPTSERFGLTSQLRSAAVSIPSNLAEGAARSSTLEFRQFLSIARGSLSELDTQLDLCVRIGLLNGTQRADLDEILIALDKTIYALRESRK